MTLPSKAKKLDENEIFSINSAVKDAGIQQIHPEKMEAFAEHLVNRLKNTHENLTS
tara:strand:- start:2082 stop:2249 length:168 start_codon:yes stop_codon:yes gene_type:complete